MPKLAVFPQRPMGTGPKMVRDVARKPSSRLGFEIVVEAAAIVPHGLSKRGFDVDQLKMIKHVPHQDAPELFDGDAPLEELVLGPERRAVHVEQRAVEVEERGGPGARGSHPGRLVQSRAARQGACARRKLLA